MACRVCDEVGALGEAPLLCSAALLSEIPHTPTASVSCSTHTHAEGIQLSKLFSGIKETGCILGLFPRLYSIASVSLERSVGLCEPPVERSLGCHRVGALTANWGTASPQKYLMRKHAPCVPYRVSVLTNITASLHPYGVIA